jgi:hypothetical protein
MDTSKDLDSILLTLFSEIEGGGHKSGFMVSAEKADVVRVVELVGQQKRDDFYAEGPSINVVP